MNNKKERTGAVKGRKQALDPKTGKWVKLQSEKPKFSTPIKKIYWAMKMEDLKRDKFFYEYKGDSEHWNKRLWPCKLELENQLTNKIDGTFLEGRIVHRVKITEIKVFPIQRVPKRYRHESVVESQDCWRLKCYMAKED